MSEERFEAGLALCRLLSQAQVAQLLGVSQGEVFALATRPPLDTLPRLLVDRGNYLARLVELLERRFGKGGVAQWLAVPHPSLEGRSPLAAFLGDWTPEDPGARIVLRIAKREAEPVA